MSKRQYSDGNFKLKPPTPIHCSTHMPLEQKLHSSSAVHAGFVTVSFHTSYAASTLQESGLQAAWSHVPGFPLSADEATNLSGWACCCHTKNNPYCWWMEAPHRHMQEHEALLSFPVAEQASKGLCVSHLLPTSAKKDWSWVFHVPRQVLHHHMLFQTLQAFSDFSPFFSFTGQTIQPQACSRVHTRMGITVLCSQ